MFGTFKRLFRIAEAETHAAIDKMEDPIKQTQQGIRDLKKDLDSSIRNLAEVKALSIRLKKELGEKKQRATSYERKAMLLLEKGQSGQIDSTEADRLANEALLKKEQASKGALTVAQDLAGQEKLIATMDGNVKNLKSQISSWENELTTLQARSKVASASKKLNQQLAQVDSSGTISMLERMKSKVEEDESIAASYGEMASLETSIDSEIDKALGGADAPNASDSLAALKAKMKIE
jgi:phage shock protein A